jgi:hypothetical protein
MFTRPSAPLTIGGVLDSAIRLYTSSFRMWLVPSLVGALLTAASVLALIFVAAPPLGGPAARGPAAAAAMLALFKSPVLWASYFAILIVSIWAYVAVFVALDAGYENQSIGPASSMLTALKLLPRALLATVYTMIFLTVGFLLFLIPGFYLMGRWFYWLPALGTERLGAMAAIRRSYALTQGHWWRGFTIVCVALVMIVVLSIAFSLAATLSSLPFIARPLVAMAINQGLGAILHAFTLPMLPAALVVGYRDLVLRKEGGDLAARVGGLAAT